MARNNSPAARRQARTEGPSDDWRPITPSDQADRVEARVNHEKNNPGYRDENYFRHYARIAPDGISIIPAGRRR